MSKLAPEVIQQLTKGLFEKASFLYLYTLELNWLFLILLQQVCDRKHVSVKGCIKNNLSRIAQKISENCIDSELHNPFRVRDLARATITVDEPRQLEDIYETIDR